MYVTQEMSLLFNTHLPCHDANVLSAQQKVAELLKTPVGDAHMTIYMYRSAAPPVSTLQDYLNESPFKDLHGVATDVITVPGFVFLVIDMGDDGDVLIEKHFEILELCQLHGNIDRDSIIPSWATSIPEKVKAFEKYHSPNAGEIFANEVKKGKNHITLGTGDTASPELPALVDFLKEVLVGQTVTLSAPRAAVADEYGQLR